MTKYQVFIDSEVHSVRKDLPGNIRQVIKRTIDNFASEPYPSNSRILNVKDIEIPQMINLSRIRIGHWRIIYAVNENENWVWVLKISHRPPYNYEDLAELLRKIV